MEDISRAITAGVLQEIAEQSGRPAKRDPVVAEAERMARIRSRSEADYSERLTKRAEKLARRAKAAGVGIAA